MPTVALDLDHWDTEQVGIVIACKTGVRWTNQAGGTACAHPEAEGIFLPLPTYLSEASLEILRDRWHVETEHVAKFLAAKKLDDVLEPSAGVGGEAWVPVRIKARLTDLDIPEFPEWARNLRPFAGSLGFLVYLNSD
jgi:hypothetical protein